MDGNFDVFSVLIIVADDAVGTRDGIKSVIAESGIKFNFNRTK